MKRAVMASVLPAIAVALFSFSPPVTAQDEGPNPNWKPAGPVPRAPEGKPDLSGVWWLGREVAVRGSSIGSPRTGEPPPVAPGSTFASLYQPWAAAKAKTLSDKDDPALRCLPSVNGPPMTAIMQIVQTPKLVVILIETYHGFRLIPTEPGRTHHEDATPAFRGDSVGRWESDTLVVDVKNFTDRNWLDPQGIVSFHSDALHVVERYRRIAANALEIEKIYEDPKALTRPFTPPRRIWRLAPFDQIMEAVCTSTETAALMEAAAKENYGRK